MRSMLSFYVCDLFDISMTIVIALVGAVADPNFEPEGAGSRSGLKDNVCFSKCRDSILVHFNASVISTFSF